MNTLKYQVVKSDVYLHRKVNVTTVCDSDSVTYVSNQKNRSQCDENERLEENHIPSKIICATSQPRPSLYLLSRQTAEYIIVRQMIRYV
jgi:hypothetical protein